MYQHLYLSDVAVSSDGIGSQVQMTAVPAALSSPHRDLLHKHAGSALNYFVKKLNTLRVCSTEANLPD